MRDRRARPFRDAQEDIESAHDIPDTPQTRSAAYRLAFDDADFLQRAELRPVRLQLELLKTEMALAEHGVESTVVMFGGARIPPPSRQDRARTDTLRDLSHFYDEARRFARLVTERSVASGGREDVIVTGGGPGVMEAGNRGAADAGGNSVGLGIVLPHEQAPNEFVTPELCFNFHYFGIRKMHFLIRAKAVAVFPGGFGTLDEMFETLTLIQTGRMQRIPVLLFGRAFWNGVVNFRALAEAGTIAEADLDLFRFVETAEEALEAMDSWAGAGTRREEIPGRVEPLHEG
ncbi:LOG family protein [Roseitranquillus sediminis]|uniref:LOG family protein n=1 Tax=Roseitranquillus sediminis TaxID=2809051 RepID=UPI001D0C4354|nr:LOG family protein [Roseitranquillus sediminis]MBM9593471.1 LOG family protein [Roseitranquillus sediminis]